MKKIKYNLIRVASAAILSLFATATFPDIDLSLSKSTSTATPDVGVPFDYTLAASQVGGDNQKGDNKNLQTVTITDSIPAGITLNSASTIFDGTVEPTATWTCVPGSGPGPFDSICTFVIDDEDFDVGDTFNTLVLNVTATADGSPIVNSAVVTNDFDTEISSPNNTDTATVTPPLLAIPPEVTKSFTPATIFEGETSVLTIGLINDLTNPSVATLDSTFTDVLPTGVVVTTPAVIGGTCTTASVTAVAGSSTVAYANSATIPIGGCVITVEVTSIDEGVYTNTIAAGTLITDLGTNTTGVTADLTVNVKVADVEVTKTMVTPAPYFVGNTVTYTIEVKNNGPEEATNVVVTDVPAGLTSVVYTAVNTTGTVNVGTCSATNSFPCTLTSMADGSTVLFTVTGEVQ